MQDVQSRDAVQFLLQIVETDDWAGLFRVLRAKAAQRDRVWNPRARNRLLVSVGDVVLVRAIILVSRLRNQQVNGGRTLKGLRHLCRVFHIADERSNALLRERFELFRIVSNHAHFFTAREECFDGGLSRISSCSTDNNHFFSMLNMSAALKRSGP